MRSPIRPLPAAVVRWTHRARWLRWADALVGWLALWLAATLALPRLAGAPAALLAGLLVVALSVPLAVRGRWRPISAPVALALSRSLRAGDRVWHVYPGGAEIALVTARRGLRIVIAPRVRGPEESIAVRRTRVFLVPAEGD